MGRQRVGWLPLSGRHPQALFAGGVGSHSSMSENYVFGITLTVIGMAGTLLSLWLLSYLISLLKKVFPYHPEESRKKS